MWPDLGPIRTFPLLFLAGILLHVPLSYRLSRRLGQCGWWWLTLSLCYAFAMTLWARVLHDLAHGLLAGPADVLEPGFVARGGLWGGPLVHLALATGLILCFARERAAVLDLAALAMPLPMAVAKVACFLNACCFGCPTRLPWGVAFPQPAESGLPAGPLHPVQLYEVALLGLVFWALVALSDRRWRGWRLAWFLLLYGGGRGLLDFLRGDMSERLPLGEVTVSQVLCLGVAAAAGLALAVNLRRAGRSTAG